MICAPTNPEYHLSGPMLLSVSHISHCHATNAVSLLHLFFLANWRSRQPANLAALTCEPKRNPKVSQSLELLLSSLVHDITAYLAMASQPSTTCVVCDKSASNKCGRCKTSIYCGKQCQASDWEEHKSACKDVLIGKTLERAASILHQAFLNFRENTWDTPVAKIEVKADALVIYDGPQPTKPRYFVDFPHKLVKDTETKMAVLCALACNEPLAWRFAGWDPRS
jgi:hypothetical protein